MNRKSNPLRRAPHVILAAVILLATLTLTASNGLTTPPPNRQFWRMAGQNSFEQQGITVHNAGDVDGDGVADVITGLHSMAANAQGNHISARVYSGKDASLLRTINAPASQSHESFNAVAGLGDLNGDGHAEFIIGTPGATPAAQARAGVARLFDGKTGALLATLSVAGLGQDAHFGASLASAGDANADGIADIIIGAPGADRAFVYSGDPTSSFTLLATLSGEEGARFGASVGRVGRIVDQDARGAVLVGAPYHPAGPDNRGRVYVLLIGVATTSPRTVFEIDGTGPHDQLGSDVDGGSDVNGDGTFDFMASAMGTEPMGPLGLGYARVFSGSDGNPLSTFTSSQPGDLFGFSAALNGPCQNAAATLVVGAPNWINGNGKIAGRVAIYNLSTGTTHTELDGENNAEGLGISVGGYVDLNGDGNAELVAGAHGESEAPALWTNGAAYVLSCVEIPRPDIVATPNPLDLGDVGVGGQKDVVLTVTNQGSADLVVSGVSFVAGSNPAFSLVGGPGAFTLPPGGNQALTIRYQPATGGIHSATLRFSSNDPDSPVYDAPLFGKGITRQLQVTPAQVNFGNVDVSDTVWANIQVKSVGNSALTISSIDLTGSTHPAYALSQKPQLPNTLLPGEQTNFHVQITPGGVGNYSGAVVVASNDPNAPSVQVSLNAQAVPPNIAPTAQISMEVPYNGDAIHFHGDGSFDPDGQITNYAWEFGHDNATSTEMNPTHQFTCTNSKPCRYVVRLTVTDNGGKSDPTSVSVLAFERDTRSRFYGTITQGGDNVPDGTVIQTYIDGKLVAESLSQTHLGRSVFAIEIPPDIQHTGDGGVDGDTVSFKYRFVTVNETGTWYSRTDQELNLSAPFYVASPGCIFDELIGIEICIEQEHIPSGGLHVMLELEEKPPPFLDPGPLKRVVQAFRLEISNAETGEPVTSFATPYTLATHYTDEELAQAGIMDETTLQLYYIVGNQWQLAGMDTVDAANNLVKSSLDHASVFALFGQTAEVTDRHNFLPVIAK